MKKNNKGFTMIEIISVVIIIGVIMLLVIPGITRLMEKFKKDYYEKVELIVTESGKEFYSDNKIYLPDGILESSYVNTSSLINSKYIENLLDYRGNSCSLEDQKSYTIVVYRGDGNYEYQTCIDCSNGEGYVSDKSGTYCDPAWINGTIGYAYCNVNNNKNCDPNNIYFYYGTAREKIREGLLKQLHIVRKNSSNDIIDSVRVGDTKEDAILPINIDIIQNKPVLDVNNKKEYQMIYKGATEGTDEKLNAVIYKHKAPQVIMTSKGTTYNPGEWTNDDVIITLKKNDEFFRLAGVDVLKYQLSKDSGKTWQDITCGMNSSDSCTIVLSDNQDQNYRFRIVNTEFNISDETNDYNIKIDKVIPTLDLDYSVSESSNGNLYIGKISYVAKDGFGNIKRIDYIEKTTKTLPGANETGTNLMGTSYKTYSEVTQNKYVFFRVVDEAGNKSNWQRANRYIGNKITVTAYDQINVGTVGDTYSLSVYKCSDSKCTSTSRTVSISNNKFNLSSNQNGNAFYKFVVISNDNDINVTRRAYLHNFELTSEYYPSTSVLISGNEQIQVKRYISDSNSSYVNAYQSSNRMYLSVYGQYTYAEDQTCDAGYSDDGNGNCVSCENGTYEDGNCIYCEHGSYDEEKGACIYNQGEGYNEYECMLHQTEFYLRWIPMHDTFNVECINPEDKVWYCEDDLNEKSCGSEGETTRVNCYGWCVADLHSEPANSYVLNPEYFYQYTVGVFVK